jgi:lysozyme
MGTNFADLKNIPGGNDYIKGIDLSHHNATVDWPSIVTEGIKLVYIKITDGVGTRDPKASELARQAQSHGLKIGYYHFARPDTRNGGTLEKDSQAEANEVLNTLTGLPAPDLPLVLDLEDSPPWDTPLTPADYLKWITSFKNTYGKKVIIYSRKSYLDAKLPADHGLNQTSDMWLARYTTDFNLAISPKGWNSWRGWQFAEDGKIGSTSPLDLSIWNNSILD